MRGGCGARNSLRFLLPCLVLLAPASGWSVDSSAVARWNADLTYLSEQLVSVHPNPFHAVPADSFAADVDALRRRLPDLEPDEIVVEIARLMARIGEGHTRLTLPLDPSQGFFQGHSKTPAPKDPRLLFHALPVRLYLFSDGLFVRRIDAKFARFAGARVVRIGSLSADSAMARVRPVVHHDNEAQLLSILADYLVIPEILHARGGIDSVGPVVLALRLKDGSEESVTLPALLDASSVAWTDARAASGVSGGVGGARTAGAAATPLWLSRPDEPFWFTTLPDRRAVYFQFNEVTNGPKETLAAFVDRLMAAVNADPDVDRLVIDLRLNPGGNGSLNRPLVTALIRCPKLRDPGSLFVLTGRQTFSAAVFLCVDIEKLTPGLFVGEATGGNPVGYGDSKKILLPESGLTVRVASLYWQPTDPRDHRQGIAPHVPVGFSSDDYANGRDPVLETALSFPGDTVGAEELAGRWTGTVSFEFNRVDVELNLARDSGGDLTGSLTAPDLGMKDTPVRNLSFEPPALSFGASADAVTLAVRARVGSGFLAGTVLVDGLSYVMVLQRASR